MISDRNAEVLISQHVISAPAVRASEPEVNRLYMVIDGGALPAYISMRRLSLPIKADIAPCTTMAKCWV